jgi:methyl-accepting chemotaxis protein
VILLNNLSQSNNRNTAWFRSIPWKPSESVGVRLFLIFFIGTMTFVLSLGIISYQMSKATIQNNAKISNQQMINQTAERLDLVLKNYADSLQQSLLSPELQDWVRQASLVNTEDRDRIILKNNISSEIGNWLFSNPGVVAVYLIPSNNQLSNITTGTHVEGLLDKVKDKDWYKTALTSKSTLWMNDVTNVDSKGNSSVIRIAKSMSGSSGYVIGVDLKTSIITDELKKIDLGVNSSTQLISTDNQLIAFSGADKTLSSNFEGLNKMESKGSILAKDDAGSAVLTVYSTLESSSWKLLSNVPVANLVKDAKKILMTTYIAAVIVAFIAILVGIWMARTVSHPLGTMGILMNDAARGNLKVRMKGKSRDEIGRLSVSFNRMMEQITALVGQTNQTVQEVLGTAGELSDASRKTATSAKEIATATEEIAIGATKLAEEAEEGNGLVDRMTSQMKIVITTNGKMGEAVRNVGESSEQGMMQLEELLKRTSITEEMTVQLVDKVNGLKMTASSVIKVLEVMQNVTQQTNILSLNASIEAARAGAAGKGFMVVADEIRKLAEQSRQSIAIVGQITDRIMIEMNETVMLLSEVTPLFGQQVTAVKETNHIFASVQSEMGNLINQLGSVTESIRGLNQSQEVLSESMSNVSSVAEESSATSEEVASLSNEQQIISEILVTLSSNLEKSSNQLKEKMDQFTI